ncbi:ISL3 family transposase [Ochrobactrum sp. BTU1]|nr:ISL3 family transposase [Ochrobactrum sp. BTU1]
MAEGRVRRFDKFLHFYKLHGSIHWFEQGDEMRARHPDLTLFQSYAAKSPADKAAALVPLADKAPSVGILPAANKFAQTLTIVQIRPEASKVVLIARSNVESSACPACGHSSKRLHSRYSRRFADLPWHGRVVQVHLGTRRLRCSNSECAQQIFTERLPDFVRPGARRTTRCGQSQLAIGFATGGEPGSRLSHKLAMPVSGDTLLRMIKAAEFEPAQSPRVIGIDDWAWRKGQRYGTIICGLGRGRVLDLLPDRNAASVAAWLKRHPGIEIIARDRAGLYAEGGAARRTGSYTDC